MNPSARARRLGLPLLLVLAATPSLLAGPFLGDAAVDWSAQGGPLLAGTIALAAAVLLHGALTTSWRRASRFLVATVLVSLAAELSGVRSSFPFGSSYLYHPALGPRIGGDVPLFIPLAWYAIAATPLVLLRHLPPAPPGRGRTRAWKKGALAVLYLVAADVFLDPLAVSVHAWAWDGGGPFFGVPVTNFPGWALVGGVVYAIQLHDDPPPPPRPHAADLLYAAAVLPLTLLGLLAAALRVGSPLPALLAAPGLLPAWVVAARAWRRRP